MDNLNEQDMILILQLTAGGHEPALQLWGRQISPEMEAVLSQFQQVQFQNDVTIVNTDDQALVLQVGLQESNTIGRVEDLISRLRLHAMNSFTAAAIIGSLFLPGELQEVHTTYERVQLMATVVVPMGVAISSFLASFRFASDPERWNNWIRALSWVNTSMSGVGPLAFYFMGNPGAGN